MPRNIANCEAASGGPRNIAKPRRSRGNTFPKHLTEEQAHRLGAAIRRTGPKTPIQAARFLGYDIPRREPGAHKPPAEWVAKVEAAVGAWLPALGLELHEELGKTSSSANAGVERYVEFRVPRPRRVSTGTPPQVVITRDPSLATWTQRDADRRAAERREQRAAFWGGAA